MMPVSIRNLSRPIHLSGCAGARHAVIGEIRQSIDGMHILVQPLSAMSFHNLSHACPKEAPNSGPLRFAKAILKVILPEVRYYVGSDTW